MSYSVTDRDIRLVQQAARTLEAEAKALFECSTVDGEFPENELLAEEDYQTLRTLQVRLDDLAARMKA